MAGPETHGGSTEPRWLFPIAEGLLRQPEDDIVDSRYLPSRPYQGIKPNLGEDEDTKYPAESSGEYARGTEVDPKSTDKWELRGDYLVRIHAEPRMALYVPDNTCPLPHNWLDIYRETKTNLLHDDESRIEDMWIPSRLRIR